MNDISAFFGKGYTEKKKKPKPKTTFPEVIPSDNSNVAINVMGKLYEGMETIEMDEGSVFVDGNNVGKLPSSSGTWFLILKGTQKNPKKISRNI